MRQLYATGDWTFVALAQRYGISDVNATDVVRGITWRHLPLAGSSKQLIG